MSGALLREHAILELHNMTTFQMLLLYDVYPLEVVQLTLRMTSCLLGAIARCAPMRLAGVICLE
jgi:hypothetical protein